MKTKFNLLLFPLTLFSSINPLFAQCDEDNWYKYGFHVGILVQTCDLATAKLINTKEARDELEFVFDGAKEDLLRDDYKSFTEFAYDDLKDCTKFLP